MRTAAIIEPNQKERRGMILPFEPHFITFNEIVYSVDMPQVILYFMLHFPRFFVSMSFVGNYLLRNYGLNASDHLLYVLQEMKDKGILEDRLVLLNRVSGTFRPGVLTALMGVSGAGKTTLMDVLSGRKTGGYVEGNITISGYPKRQETFARISGYCEQNDIHSPHVTVQESLFFSAWLRLASDINAETRKVRLPVLNSLLD